MSKSIAIDGTAGSGKGTISKLLAQKLGFYYLDTGAIYRTIAYAVIHSNIDIHDEKKIEGALKSFDIKIKLENGEQKNLFNGEDLGNKIRTFEIDDASGIISTYLGVRKYATDIQLEIAKKYNIIVEGRDIGTVVLPTADYKFYITASPEVRARRRLLQNGLPESEFDNMVERIIERDRRDLTREISPLKKAEDAIFIDNSNQTVEETLNFMLDVIKK